MSARHCGLFLILIYCQISLYLTQPLNNNTTNDSIITTSLPSITTTAIESTLQYYTTSSTLIPNNASTITVTLYFDIDPISITNDLLVELTATFEALLIKSAKNNGYQEQDDIFYIQPISNASNTNIGDTNLYLQWEIIVLIPGDEHLVTVLVDYLLSAKFIKQFNDNLNENLQLITVEIYPPNTTTSTTSTTTTETEHVDTPQYEEYKFILPQHLREYMLFYVVLFCVINISLCCCGGWFCTMKFIANEMNSTEKVVEDDEDNVLNGEVKGNDVYINTNTNENGTNKWDEIDKTEAEYMMKAYDDDEALQQNWFKYDSDNANSDEIQMINVATRESYNESLDFQEKLKIHSAFDED